ncbi:MAG: hypothetical protein PW792_01805 [Acidobacteriaceae bacterium]|nr:hypothetical protein [Acidobacteriaceae bacterium]
MSTRRRFLSLSAASVSVLALPKRLFALTSQNTFANASLGAYTQGLMTKQHLEALVGSTFTVFLSDGGYSQIRLREISTPTEKTDTERTEERKKYTVAPAGADLSAVRAALQPSPFTLRFDVLGKDFPQDSYLLDNGTLGRVTMFLVPGGPGKCTATFCNFVIATAAPVHKSGLMTF